VDGDGTPLDDPTLLINSVVPCPGYASMDPLRLIGDERQIAAGVPPRLRAHGGSNTTAVCHRCG
jgi:hypothetical protein